MKKLTQINVFSYAKALSAATVFLSVLVTAADVGIRRSTGDLITALSDRQIHCFPWWIPVGLAALLLLLKFSLPYVKTRLTNRLQEALYVALEEKALHAAQGALDGIDPGTAGTYFTSDIAGIIRYADRIAGIAVPDVFTFLFSVTVLSMMNPWLGLAAVLSSVVPVTAMFFMSRTLVCGNAKYQEAVQKINQRISAFFYNLELMKANGMEAALETEHSALLEKLLCEKRRLSRREALFSFPMLFSSFFTILVISVLGGFFVLHGKLLAGELFTAITLADYVVSPVMRFQNTVSQVRRAEVNFSRLNQFFTLPEEAQTTEYVHIQKALKASIFIRDLSFCYPDGKDVFCEAGFHWEQGKLHALIGENGAGKSSLLKLLSAIYTPRDGRIEVNGIEGANPISIEMLRQQIVIDSQHAVLFADTVAFNLSPGRAVSQEQMEAVCKKAGIHEDILALPDGYATQLKADGAPLSGGQKRRLCLARALLREAAVYIFDEPSVGSDPEHIATMLEALRTLAAEKLVIVITHEPAVIQAAETVTRLEACL